MKIRTKVLALVGGLFAVLAVSQIAVQRSVLLPGFAALEQDAARTNMQRVAFTMDREVELLTIIGRDYGDWADTYRYMVKQNADYEFDNLTEQSIAKLRVNVMALIAPDGHYVWSISRELEDGAKLDIDLTAQGRLPDGHPWRAAVANATESAGLLRTSRGPMLAMISPILDGTGNGPSHGMIFLGRLVTAEELDRIGDQAQVDLTFGALERGASPRVGEDVLSEVGSSLRVERVFGDVTGAPVLTLRIDLPRSISAYGREVVRSAALFLFLTGGLVLAAILYALNREVLSPLTRVTRHAVAIGDSDDLTQRLDLGRSDELGELAREFDGMVDRLAQARRELIDRSFDAGIAENASGILHNLGNAMTPLAAQVSGLQSALLSAPIDDLELAVAELRKPDVDAARRAELEQFLQLAGADVVRCIADARGGADSLAQQTLTIQQILADQQRHARARRVVETVRLCDLLAQSADLVPPVLRTRVDVLAEPSLEDFRPLRLPRTTLQQVFQNLLVNAAEAIRDDGREHGTIRVAIESSRTSDGDRLRLRFVDDGPGIAPENLTRIFAKGFSTKPAATNSGIGLHWCANAIAALGGRIYAEARPPGAGAALCIELPADAALAEPTATRNVA